MTRHRSKPSGKLIPSIRGREREVEPWAGRGKPGQCRRPLAMSPGKSPRDAQQPAEPSVSDGEMDTACGIARTHQAGESWG